MKEWIRDGVISRLSQSSTVIVYETSDNARFIEFMKFLRSLLDPKSQLRANEVYVFIEGDKLYKMRRTGESVVMEPVKVSGGLMNTTQYIEDIHGAINYMNPVLLKKVSTDADFNVVFTMYLVNRRDENIENKIRFYTSYLVSNVPDGDGFMSNLYENRNVIFIFTDNVGAIMSDATLRYVKVVRVPVSTPEERREIIVAALKDLGFQRPRRELVDRLVTMTAGMNLHETESVIIESFTRGKGKIDLEVVKAVKNEIIRKTGLLDVYDETEYGFEQIGGYEYLKDFVRLNIVKVINEKERAEKLGLRIPRGILLFGPPGTGKTLFAKAIAKETKLPFIRLKMENIFTKWYGETESKLAKAIELVEAMSPAIVFIDEIDRFGARGQGEHEVTRRVFSMLLEWLGDKERKSIIIATTNRPQDLDEAFIRVGRFDYIIPVLYPDKDARREILRVHTEVVRKVPLAEDVDLDEIAERTEFFTGAELEEVVLRAIRYAFREDRDVVTMQDFRSAMGSLFIDPEQRMKQRNEYMELAKTYTNDREILMLTSRM